MSGFSGSSSSSGNNKRPFEGDDVSSNKKSFFTVLGANTASSKLDESSFPSTSFDSLTQLLSWFQTNQFQGLEDLEFKASETCGGSLGCFAKKDFAVGDLLFTVPQSSILSTAHVLQSPITKFIYEEAIKRKMLSKISVELLVWLCMIDEQRDDQHFQVYVQSLAKYSPSLLNWDPNLLALFDQTNLGTTIKTLEGKLNEYAELLREMRRWNKPTSEQLLPVERFNFNSLVWACGHYLSRRYPGQYGAPTSQDASIDLSKFSREADMGNVGAMIPLLDILNHSHEQEWLKFEVKDGALHVLCNYPVKAGEELLSNYGDLSNEQLLFAYGYALPSNPNDCFFVKLKLPVGNVEPPSKKNKKPQAPMQTESRIFSIKSGGWEGIPKDIFQALAKLTQAADSTYQPSSNEMGFNEEECNILLDYMMANICKMGVNHVHRSMKLLKFGVDLQMKFPTDKDAEDEDDEVVLDEHTLLPEASISVVAKTNVASGSVERAKFVAYYFLGQYQILMEASHDLQIMLGDAVGEEGEGEDGDEEQGEEDDDDDDDDE